MLAAQPAPRVLPSRRATAERVPLGLFVLLGVVVFLFTASDGTLRAFFNVYLDTRLAVAPAQIGVTMGLGQLLPVVAALTVAAVGGLLLAVLDFRGLFCRTGGLAASAAVMTWAYQRAHQVRLAAASQAVKPGV